MVIVLGRDFMMEVNISAKYVGEKWMKRFLITIFAVFSMILWSCRSVETNILGKVENEIGKQIENNCVRERKCVLEINSVTDFQWDKMFVFDFGVERDKIVEIIGLNVSVSDDLTRKIVFIRNSKVVYLEESTSSIETSVRGEVIFAETDRKNFAEYTYNSKFLAEVNEGTYYLKCSNCN